MLRFIRGFGCPIVDLQVLIEDSVVRMFAVRYKSRVHLVLEVDIDVCMRAGMFWAGRRFSSCQTGGVKTRRSTVVSWCLWVRLARMERGWRAWRPPPGNTVPESLPYTRQAWHSPPRTQHSKLRLAASFTV